MAWDQTTLQNVHTPVLVGRRFLLLCQDKKMAELKECTEIPVKIRSCSKNVLYLSVKVIGTQLLLEKTFFTCSDRDDPPPPHPCFWVAIRTTRKSTLFAEQRLCLLPPLFEDHNEYWSAPWNQTRNLPPCKKDRGAKLAIFPIIWFNWLAVGFKIVLSFFFFHIYHTFSIKRQAPKWKIIGNKPTQEFIFLVQ